MTQQTDIHTPFLLRLAHHYAEESRSLYDCCFVFPNRRSGTFFRHYLSDAVEGTFLMPDIITMGQLVARFSPAVEAHRIDQLFLLYDEYRRITADVPDDVRLSFDRFAFWGDMILNDFTDIDQYMADADRLFTNLREYNEISTDPLTDEQREVLRMYFGDKVGEAREEFWRHTAQEKPNEAEREFRRLWALLPDLYHGFRERLSERNLSYQGQIYRTAVASIASDIEAGKLPYRRFIFVGFNHLSTAECRIMEQLRKAGVASFHWDYSSPLLHDADNIGSTFIRANVAHFPGLKWESEPIDSRPEVNIYSVASQVGQAKLTGRLLKEWEESGAMTDLTRTAIVIPDESLLLPMRDAVPAEVADINVSMSISLRTSAVAIVVSLLRQLHERARLSKGKWLYFHQDVKNLLTDPVVHRIAPVQIDKELSDVSLKRLYMVEEQQLADIHPRLARLVAPLKREGDASDGLNDPQLIISYLYDVIDIVEELLADSDGEVEAAAVKQYRAAVERLEGLIARSNLQSLSDTTFFFLVERLVASVKINFEGEPLRGLQIISPAEARLLDFDNLVFLSFNERVYPRRQRSGSFISNMLRACYGLPTIADVDAAMTYDFYRMLSRTRRVALVFDNRTVGLNTGEPSRFAQQLLNIYFDRFRITSHNVNYQLSSDPLPELVVPKSPEIMAELEKFRHPADPDVKNDPQARYLSASAIEKFIQCPMQFYLSKIARLDKEQDADPFVEASTFGTIVHDTLKELYSGQLHGDISAENIKAKLTPDVVKRVISRVTNRVFLHKDDSDETQSGVSFLVETVVRQYVAAVLAYDAKFGPFRIVSSEDKEQRFWQLTPEVGFNFVQYIDRLDRDADGRLHIVDYKTGGDEPRANLIDALFISGNKHKGIFQLFIYSLFHNYCTGRDEAIRPELYRIKEMASDGNKSQAVIIANQLVEDCRDHATAFIDNLQFQLTKLFDPDEPFRCCAPGGSNSPCTFCNFTNICGR